MRTLSPNLNIGSVNPSFRVNLSAGQGPIVGADKVDWNTETLDTNGDFASGRHTPTIAGQYFYTSTIRFTAPNINSGLFVYIYKNGVKVASVGTVPHNTNNLDSQTVSDVIDMNGSTDYVEIFVEDLFQNTTFLINVATQNTFSGFRISPN